MDPASERGGCSRFSGRLWKSRPPGDMWRILPSFMANLEDLLTLGRSRLMAVSLMPSLRRRARYSRQSSTVISAAS